MELTSIQQNNVTVVSVAGDLDAAASAEATGYLGAEIAAGHVNLVIDMSGVTYLSSAGLRVILGTVREARSNQGDVRLAGAEGNIGRVIDMSGFVEIVKIFPTAQEAVASFSPGG